MALIRRVSRLLRADLHAVLDQLEEPDVLLKQAIREMEQTLTEDTAEYKRLQGLGQELGRRERELSESLTGLAEELDLCFENGAESLAKGLIRQKLESESVIKSLAAKRTDTLERAEAIKQRLDDNRNRLEQTKRQAELLIRERPTEHDESTGQPYEPLIRDQQVEIALLKEREKRGLS